MEIFKNQTATISELTTLLLEIEKELDASLSPNYRAMQCLRVDRSGWAPELYSSDAEAIWGEMLESHPDDIEVLHHLAILHHARAMDLERSGDPLKSDRDWELAGVYWKRLWSCDPFWEKLSGPSGGGTNAAPARKRDQLPGKLIQIHFDLAYDERTPVHRAKRHLQLAAKLDFPGNILEDVRQITYDRITAALPEQVWGGMSCDLAVVGEACKRILKVLEIDPDCLPALLDVLRLQTRIIHLRLGELNAVQEDNPDKASTQFEKIGSDSEVWAPYIAQLVNRQSGIAEDSKEQLAFWCRLTGESLLAAKAFRKARKRFELGCQIELAEDTNVTTCCARAGEAHALEARHLAESVSEHDKMAYRKAVSIEAGTWPTGNTLADLLNPPFASRRPRQPWAPAWPGVGFPGLAAQTLKGSPVQKVRSKCASVLSRKAVTPVMHFLVANAHALLNDFQEAIAVCDRGLKLPAPAGDGDLDEVKGFQHGLDMLRKLKEEMEAAENMRSQIADLWADFKKKNIPDDFIVYDAVCVYKLMALLLEEKTHDANTMGVVFGKFLEALKKDPDAYFMRKGLFIR